MTRCGICDRPCVPMADYDAPVCLKCDSRFEAIDLRASLPVPGERLDLRPIFDRIRTELAAS